MVIEPLVYLNGRLLPAPQASLAFSDAGFVQGATVTEMTRTFGRQPWRLEAHLDRLFAGLRCTHLDPGLSQQQMAAVAHELVEHNARLLPDGEELGIIHFVTPGDYPTYPQPTVCVHTFPLPFERWASKMQTGAHLVTPSVRQVPPQCWGPHIKCRSRMHYFLADQEARRRDPDASALLLDLAGHVTETSTSSFLMYIRGALVSPPAEWILPGVSLAMIRELAASLGIPHAERSFFIDEALQADEAFTTSTPYCLMPVTRINGAAIGAGRPGPLFGRLLAAWSAAVGLDVGAQIHDMAQERLRRGNECAS